MPQSKALALNTLAGPKKSFSVIDALLQKYLQSKGYDVLMRTSLESHGTYTYHVEKEGMPYWVKLGHVESADRWAEIGKKREETDAPQRRIDDLKNEVAALTVLWLKFPSGETDSFQFPPGPEEVFDGKYEGLTLYGYARFVVEGKILGKPLRDGSESFSNWIEPCAKMIKTIDVLPDLHLPRTELKKEVNFEKLISENVMFWHDRLKTVSKNANSGVDVTLMEQARGIVNETRDYFASRKIVTGTVHGDFQPEHIVYLEGTDLPTLVQFSKLCKWYARHWDIATMYGWVAVVVGDIEGARMFWKRMIEKMSLSKDRVDYLKVITNVVTLGAMSTFVEPGWEGGKLKVGVDAFVK